MAKNVLNNLVETLVEEYAPKKIILFGSHAWGKPGKDSDIDLFIVKETRKNPRERFVEVKKILYGLHSPVPVEPLVLTPKELEKRIAHADPFVLAILKKGKSLYGQ